MTNSRLTDPEVLEWRFPVRLEEFRIRRNSGGAGRYRGGDGVERRIRFLQSMAAVLLANHSRSRHSASKVARRSHGKNWIERADGSIEKFGATHAANMNVDDVFVIQTPGGGGFGRRRTNRPGWRAPASSVPRSSTTTSRSTTRWRRWSSIGCSFLPSIRCGHDARILDLCSRLLFTALGGVIFGHLGDRFGRRFVLVTTLLIMGVTTALMGLLPTYATGGRVEPGPACHTAFLQGAALGGEWAGAVLLSVEHGEPRRRGRNGSWAQMGPSLGVARDRNDCVADMAIRRGVSRMGLAATVLRQRAPGRFGLWIRIGVDETPLFRQLEREQAKARARSEKSFARTGAAC